MQRKVPVTFGQTVIGHTATWPIPVTFSRTVIGRADGYEKLVVLRSSCCAFCLRLGLGCRTGVYLDADRKVV